MKNISIALCLFFAFGIFAQEPISIKTKEEILRELAHKEKEDSNIKVEIVSLPSERGIYVPAVFTVPTGDKQFSAVILCHGHGGSKDETGGFVTLSRSLATIGIASIRMDFPGCGESKEDFTKQNNMTNMLSDVETAKTFLAGDDRIDMSKLGIVGYSMGGRIVMLTADESYQAAVLLAPAGTTGAVDIFTVMQCKDQEAFDTLYDAAKENGEVTYTTIFGFDQTLGVQWFDDMLSYDPVTKFAGFKGDLLTIYGDLDIIITPETAIAASGAALNANSSALFEVKGADHGFGLHSNEPELMQQAINRIIVFFMEKLQ